LPRKDTESHGRKNTSKNRRKNRISICHGRTRNLTEKTEAETRKKIVAAAEAFATDGHGRTRKEE